MNFDTLTIFAVVLASLVFFAGGIYQASQTAEALEETEKRRIQGFTMDCVDGNPQLYIKESKHADL